VDRGNLAVVSHEPNLLSEQWLAQHNGIFESEPEIDLPIGHLVDLSIALETLQNPADTLHGGCSDLLVFAQYFGGFEKPAVYPQLFNGRGTFDCLKDRAQRRDTSETL
jgi:hypothetical protein